MNKNSPAVSVIVPMFNAEKYLPVCLESLLIQTFTDFEVIVVDDCSTDQSLTVAESYLERFGGRLKIFSLEENTGSGAVPRNVGLDLSCGKYIYFVDADDLLIDNALETFHAFAENFGADVVYTEAFFTCGKEIVPTELYVAPWNPTLTVDEPTFESDDFSVRVKKFIDVHVRWTPWTKFVRRDLLVDNNVKFPAMRISEDGVWTFELLCLAKRWLRVPTSLYVYRLHKEEIAVRRFTPQEELKLWLDPLLTGVEQLDKFMRGFEFFKRHPNYGVRVINSWANESFSYMSRSIKELSPSEVYELFRHEFSKTNGSDPSLAAYLLFIAITYRNESMR